MNSVRTPLIILAAIIIGLCAWYVFSNRTAPAPQTQAATVPQQAAAQETPSPNLDEAAVAANISGTWQSTDDPNYSVVATSGGKWTDTYRSDASSSVSQTGAYTLFTSQHPDPDFTGVLMPGVVYLKIAEGSSTLYFSVLEASGSALQLSYLDRGNTLSFTKVQ